MSLLLKALQKAAENRENAANPGDAGAEAAPPRPPRQAPAEPQQPPEGDLELTLEPMAGAQARREPVSSPVSSPAPTAAADEEVEISFDPVPSRLAASPEHAQTVLQASAPGAGAGLVDYMRERPLIPIGAVAGLFGLGYAVYVYLQIYHPGAFVRGPPPVTAATPPAQVAKGPIVSPPAAPPAAPAPAPVAAVAPPPAEPLPVAAGASAAAGAVTTPAATSPVAAGQPSAPSAAAPPAPPPGPAAVASPPATPSPAAPDRMGEPIRAAGMPAPPPAAAGRPGAASPPRQAAPAGRTTAAAAARPPRSRPPAADRTPAAAPVVVAVDTTLMAGYEALQRGDYVQAEGAYRDVLAREPGNVDALLGLAGTMVQLGRAEDASRLYMRVLELDPRSSHAQAGLIGLIGRADPGASEARLKQLIAREPSGFLWFTLGNLQAELGNWPSAQSAYFQAFQLAPDNPDYAFNLAVGLEHVSQQKIALDYYRRAVDIARKRGSARFDLAGAEGRIKTLEAALASAP